MGFFQNIKTAKIGNKIAVKTAKCAGEMVNHLILDGHHVKTHDTLNITFSFFNYYMATGLALHNDKPNDFRLSIIHFARQEIIQWLKKVVLTDAMGVAGIENIFNESGEYDENFNAYLQLHKEKIPEYEKENKQDPEIALKKTTAEHLIYYLNTVFELNETQKNEIKDFALQKLKFNQLYWFKNSMVKEKQILTMISISAIINELKSAVFEKIVDDIVESAKENTNNDELYSLDFLYDKTTNF